MKIIIYLLFFFSSNIIAQTAKYEIKILDTNNEEAHISSLTLDDSIFVSCDFEDIINRESRFFIEINEGNHSVEASVMGYKLLDTIIYFSSNIPVIELYVNTKRDFHLSEFHDGIYRKIYTNKGSGTIIGLKNDSTFKMKRFIHPGYIAYFLIEKGTYILKNNMLSLTVTGYERSDREPPVLPYTYYFSVNGDTIVDIEKYGMQVGHGIQ